MKKIIFINLLLLLTIVNKPQAQANVYQQKQLNAYIKTYQKLHGYINQLSIRYRSQVNLVERKKNRRAFWVKPIRTDLYRSVAQVTNPRYPRLNKALHGMVTDIKKMVPISKIINNPRVRPSNATKQEQMKKLEVLFADIRKHGINFQNVVSSRYKKTCHPTSDVHKVLYLMNKFLDINRVHHQNLTWYVAFTYYSNLNTKRATAYLMAIKLWQEEVRKTGKLKLNLQTAKWWNSFQEFVEDRNQRCLKIIGKNKETMQNAFLFTNYFPLQPYSLHNYVLNANKQIGNHLYAIPLFINMELGLPPMDDNQTKDVEYNHEKKESLQNKGKLDVKAAVRALNAYVLLIDNIGVHQGKYAAFVKNSREYSLNFYKERLLSIHKEKGRIAKSNQTPCFPKSFPQIKNWHHEPSHLFDANFYSKNLPPAHREQLKKMTKELLHHTNKLNQEAQALEKNLEERRLKDDFSVLVQRLEAHSKLVQNVQLKTERIYAYLQKLHLLYTKKTPPVKYSSEWKLLTNAVKAMQPVVQAIRRFEQGDFRALMNPDIYKKSTRLRDSVAKVPYFSVSTIYTAVKVLMDEVSTLPQAKGRFQMNYSTVNLVIRYYNHLIFYYHQEMTAYDLRKMNLLRKETIDGTYPAYKGYTPCACKETSHVKSAAPPNNICIVLDVNNKEMKQRRHMLKRAIRHLVTTLRPQDHVSIINMSNRGYNSQAPVSGARKEKIIQAFDQAADTRYGTFGLSGSFEYAYRFLQENFKREGNNRIIFISDGLYNIRFQHSRLSDRNAELPLRHKSMTEWHNQVSAKEAEGVDLSVLSFAWRYDAYEKLKMLSNFAKGFYVPVSEDNLSENLVQEFWRNRHGKKGYAKEQKPCDCEQRRTNMTSMQGFAHNNLMLLLDVSGSMNDPHKLPLLKKSLKYLVSIMRPEDRVSIVTYAGDAAVALKPTSAAQKQYIEEALGKLKSQGKTNVKAGFKLAYKTIGKTLHPDENTRIILATDGEFQLEKSIVKWVEKNAKKGIKLSVFNFGNNKNPSKNLQVLAQKGQGNFKGIKTNNVTRELVKEAQSKLMKQ